MNAQEGYFTNQENHQLYYQYWHPEGKTRGILMLIHGLHDHSGRYQHVASYFSKQGFATYGIDLPGHGKSEGTRSYVKSFDEYNQSLLEYLQIIKEQQAGIPVFIIGHSLGGLIGATFLIDHQDKFQGAVLSGSLALVPDYVSDLTIRIGKLIGRILPKFRILPLDIANISQDPEVVEAYRHDPLVYQGKVTARLSAEINNAISRLAREGYRIEIPLLLLHGTEDRLCDPACSQFLHDLSSSVDKELIFYPGFYHEVYNEPETDRVFQDVSKWLNRQLNY
jgi:alpha-beta hydrolase superfamily lysophospholipase